MTEEWRDVEGFEEKYQVSNLGRVKSLPRNGTIKEERLLKFNEDDDGYFRINLSIAKRVSTTKGAHRLVAQAFIPNPENKLQVNHKDGNKQNNLVENLEWCTNRENQQHAWDTGLQIAITGEDHANSKLTQADVDAIRERFKAGEADFEIAKDYVVDSTQISRIRKGLRWAATATEIYPASTGNKKLTQTDVDQIRTRIAAGDTDKSIAQDYTVGAPCINKIRTGTRWRQK